MEIIKTPLARHRVDFPDGAQCFSQLSGGDLLPIKSETTVVMTGTIAVFLTAGNLKKIIERAHNFFLHMGQRR